MLNLSDVTKYYKINIGVEDINLSFEPGEIVGIFGENGSGKTTLLKTILGLTSKNKGKITLDNKEIEGSFFEKISFISMQGSFFPHLTIFEHRDFYKKMYPLFSLDRFNTLIDFFKLDPKKTARSLSSVQRANLDFCIGISKMCDYILMDEPFIAKDIFARSDLLKLIISMQTKEECFLIASHQIFEIENFITRVIILKSGKVVSDKKIEYFEENNIKIIDLIKECYDYDEAKISKLFLNEY